MSALVSTGSSTGATATICDLAAAIDAAPPHFRCGAAGLRRPVADSLRGSVVDGVPDVGHELPRHTLKGRVGHGHDRQRVCTIDEPAIAVSAGPVKRSGRLRRRDGVRICKHCPAEAEAPTRPAGRSLRSELIGRHHLDCFRLQDRTTPEPDGFQKVQDVARSPHHPTPA